MTAGQRIRTSILPRREASAGVMERNWTWMLIVLGTFHTLAYISFWIVMHLKSQAWAPGQVLDPLDGYWRWFYSTIFSEARVMASRRSQEAEFHPFLMLASLGAISAAYLGLLRWFRSLPQRITPTFWTIGGLVLLASVPLLLLPNLLSGDVYSNISFGRVAVVHGGNPFIDPPSAFPGDSYYRWVNWRSVPSVYGPGWIYPSIVLTVIVNTIGASIIRYVLAYKLLALGLHLINGLLIWSILGRRRPEQRIWGTALYLLNPLALVEFVGNAHNDVLMITFILLGILMHVRGHWYWAIGAFTLAVLTKWIALPLLPLYGLALLWESPTWRERIWRTVLSLAIFAGLCVGLYRPYWEGSRTLDILFTAPPQTRLINSLGDVIASDIQRAMWALGRWPNPALVDLPSLFSGGQPVSLNGQALAEESEQNVWDQQRAEFQRDRSFFRNQARLAQFNRDRVGSWVRTGALIILAASCLIAAAITRSTRRAIEATAWIFFIYCSIGAVWFWPWYVTWFVALAALLDWRVTGRTAILLSLLVPLTYVFYPNLSDPVWWQRYRAVIIFLPPLLFAAWHGLSMLRRWWSDRQPTPEPTA